MTRSVLSDFINPKGKKSQKRALHLAFFMLMILLASLTLLSACGKRPGTLDPPPNSGVDKKAFPRTYPDISTDPAP